MLHTRGDNLNPGMALWKQSMLTYALAADVSFEIFSLWSLPIRQMTYDMGFNPSTQR
jgi:hypothetical protein